MSTRREFLGYAAATMMTTALNQQTFAGTKGPIPYRTLGRTEEKVSAIGIGGYHLGRPGVDVEESKRIVRSALDEGINFLDNCWDYNNGESEVRMGSALRDGYRQKAFLMTKIDGRDKTTATNQINQSLKRLQTDHIDLLQFHEVNAIPTRTESSRREGRSRQSSRRERMARFDTSDLLAIRVQTFTSRCWRLRLHMISRSTQSKCR